MASSPANLRALYRSLLRELPPRPILASPRTPIHNRIRSSFAETSNSNSSASSPHDAEHQAQLAHQAVTYLRAQRMYVTLVERYNPGMEMSQDERIRLTARRVGMDLPAAKKEKK
jgi:ATP synthase assembly factor FMC1